MNNKIIRYGSSVFLALTFIDIGYFWGIIHYRSTVWLLILCSIGILYAISDMVLRKIEAKTRWDLREDLRQERDHIRSLQGEIMRLRVGTRGGNRW